MTYVQLLFLGVDEARLKLGMTIDEVAPLCGVTPLSYKRWRKGKPIQAEREHILQAVLKQLKTYGG